MVNLYTYIMNDLNDFLNKLESINFNDVTGKVLSSADGWSLTLETAFHGSAFMAVQIVARVRFNNVIASHWGASSNDDNKTLVHWFLAKESQIFADEYGVQKEQQKIAKDLFNNL